MIPDFVENNNVLALVFHVFSMRLMKVRMVPVEPQFHTQPLIENDSVRYLKIVSICDSFQEI